MQKPLTKGDTGFIRLRAQTGGEYAEGWIVVPVTIIDDPAPPRFGFSVLTVEPIGGAGVAKISDARFHATVAEAINSNE